MLRNDPTGEEDQILPPPPSSIMYLFILPTPNILATTKQTILKPPKPTFQTYWSKSTNLCPVTDMDAGKFRLLETLTLLVVTFLVTWKLQWIKRLEFDYGDVC